MRKECERQKVNKLEKFLKNIRFDASYLVLFVFLMLLFSRYVVSMLGDASNEYLAVIILQLLTFGFPAAITYRLKSIDLFGAPSKKREPYHRQIRMTAVRPAYAVITVATVFALISGCLLLSINFTGKSSLEGSFSLYDTFISKYNGTSLGAVWLLLAYAALPAFCEEMIFRGIVLSEYEEKYGKVCAFAMSTVFFAFLHFNISKLPVYLFAGALLTALLYATRNLFCTMLAHFAYNVFGIFGQQYVTEFYVTAGNMWAVVIVLLAMLLLSASVFCGSASRLYGMYSKNDAPSDEVEKTDKKTLSDAFKQCLSTPGAVICFLLFAAVCIIFALI